MQAKIEMPDSGKSKEQGWSFVPTRNAARPVARLMVPIHARVRRGEDRWRRILAAGKSSDLEQYVGIARDTMTETKARTLHSLAQRTDAGDSRFNTVPEHCL